ncbi:nuclear transport factor 2 family protein [Actinoplanes sp. NPDC051859]|uniref:nuclear transport factor 2 family protein n=1 Tax=Actinoplanes sp. NPDC051859 TaxID=3363909 RepID=UPI00378ECBB7
MTPTDVEAVEDLVRAFFAAFVSGPDSTARVDTLREILHPRAVIFASGSPDPTVYDVDSFIEPRRALLAGDRLSDFREWALPGRTEVFDGIAQHCCPYEKSGVLDGESFTGRGTKTFQFVRTGAGWRISAVAWVDLPS